MLVPCTVIVNPAAANGRAGRLGPRLVRELKSHGFAPEVLLTTAPGDAVGLARHAIIRGQETIIAIGGDGTLNEVVNGFFAEGQVGQADGGWTGRGCHLPTSPRAINPAARLGIICCGTGSDFVKSIGLPPGIAAIPHLAQGHVVAVDLGVVSYRDLRGRPSARCFLNVAGMGLSGETVRRANSTSKALGGFVSFLWSATRTILTYRSKRVEVILDGGVPERRRAVIIVVANGRYWGGGMRAAPAARLVDGYFDVFVLGEVSRVQLLFDLLPRIYLGAHVGHPKVWSGRGKHLVVRSEDGMLVDVDGELVGSTDAELSLLPAALPILVPANRPAPLLSTDLSGGNL